MLIKFNAKRVLGYSHPKHESGRIIPGVQEIHDDVVIDMLGDKILAHKFESGELEAVDRDAIGALRVKRKKGLPASGVQILLAANEREALKLAVKTVDMELLKQWANQEKRPSVRKAVVNQIRKIRDIKYRDDEKSPKLESPSSNDDGDDGDF